MKGVWGLELHWVPYVLSAGSLTMLLLRVRHCQPFLLQTLRSLGGSLLGDVPGLRFLLLAGLWAPSFCICRHLGQNHLGTERPWDTAAQMGDPALRGRCLLGNAPVPSSGRARNLLRSRCSERGGARLGCPAQPRLLRAQSSVALGMCEQQAWAAGSEGGAVRNEPGLS